MANTFLPNVWRLDTAGVITTEAVRIRGLRWVSKSATAGDDISLEDKSGEKVWESVATGSNYVEAQDFGVNGQNFNGLELAVLDSGTLYVYYV